MSRIADISAYLKRMDASLLDKCWWIDKIPDEITTVADFGCAAGNLKSMIDYLMPRRFRYIGIDNSAEMRRLCQEKNIEVYRSIEALPSDIDPDRTILVMNSVIHEIWTYLSIGEVVSLQHQISRCKFKYIAIRDMDWGHPQYEDVDDIVKTFEHSVYAQQWQYLYEHDYRDVHTCIKEFLLKYWYTENWERERDERYLWDISSIAHGFEYYIEEFEDHFYIPYVRDRAITDFGIVSNECTHIKLLMKYAG